MIEIRTGTIDDTDKLAAIEAECFPPAEAATKDILKNRLICYGNHFWLLFKNGVLVSFVDGMVTDDPDLQDEMYEKADMHNENGNWQMIFGVNTVPAERRRGYAGKLLRRAIADAQLQGRKGVVLTCKTELIPYYRQFGFAEEGKSKSIHGNVTWYQMRLTF